jgi:hypothetical protein
MAVAGAVLGATMTLWVGGREAITWYSVRQENAVLKTRALDIVDAMLAGDYQKVWTETPADYRARWPGGVQSLRDVFAPQFNGVGKMVERDLKSILHQPWKEGTFIVQAEVNIEFERRYLTATVWFSPAADGGWRFEGVGVSETLASQMRFADEKHPDPIAGPYEVRYDDEHHHH